MPVLSRNTVARIMLHLTYEEEDIITVMKFAGPDLQILLTHQLNVSADLRRELRACMQAEGASEPGLDGAREIIEALVDNFHFYTGNLKVYEQATRWLEAHRTPAGEGSSGRGVE
jgi:hypothetical protein